jgi:hypothetical protein
MASFASTVIECPFYLSDEARSLTCEGMLEGSSTKTTFASREALRAQITRHCAGDFRHCPWYIALMSAKYNEPTR